MSKNLVLKIPESNKLWLKWEKVIHLGNGEIKLEDTILYGPVMSDCEPIEEQGTIKLDLTGHYLLILLSPYIVDLSWKGKTSQTNSRARFKTMFLKDSDLGRLSILKNDDEILIDCTDQTTEVRSQNKFKAAYNAIVFNSLKNPYDFSSK